MLKRLEETSSEEDEGGHESIDFVNIAQDKRLKRVKLRTEFVWLLQKAICLKDGLIHWTREKRTQEM